MDAYVKITIYRLHIGLSLGVSQNGEDTFVSLLQCDSSSFYKAARF